MQDALDVRVAEFVVPHTGVQNHFENAKFCLGKPRVGSWRHTVTTLDGRERRIGVFCNLVGAH